MTTDVNGSPATEPLKQDRTIIALAWPTGRPIYPYTVEEIAAGVDLYTRRLKAGQDIGGGDVDAQ
jgi:hypothetical protein